ncbi:MAG: histidine kinase dimerization/phospho-acceptor domain-containing protein, partial [Opitutaceae bacterium]
MKSIRHHLTRSLLATFGLLFIGGLAAIFGLVRIALIKSFDRALLAKAQAISTLVMLDGDRVTLNFSDKFMREFDDGVAREFFEVRRENGVSVQRSESLGAGHLPDQVGTFAQPRYWPVALPRKLSGRALGVEFVPRGAIKAATRANTEKFHLVVAADSAGLDEDLREILLVIGGSGTLLLGLTALLVPVLLGRGLRPLVALSDRVEAIDSTTLASRLPIEGLPRELQVITSRLNALLARLELSFERERRVSAALAHELRTPIAELRHLAEAALKWPEMRDPETDRDAREIARQMEALVTHMLTLARSEAGQLVPQRETLTLDRAVAQAWKPLAEVAAAKCCQIHFSLEPILVEADPVLLRSILSNLLENAVEYCPPQGAIRVSLASASGGFSLSMTNTACGLTAA